MEEIKKDVLCRLGKDWRGSRLFIGELGGLDAEIAEMVLRRTGLGSEELHKLTCNIVKSGRPSRTGDNFLSEKVLRLKMKVVLEECELVDDQEAGPRPVQDIVEI